MDSLKTTHTHRGPVPNWPVPSTTPLPGVTASQLKCALLMKDLLLMEEPGSGRHHGNRQTPYFFILHEKPTEIKALKYKMKSAGLFVVNDIDI